MFCPKCKYEYVPGIKVCSTCGAELVEELSEENSNKVTELVYTKLVTVYVTNDLGKLAVAKSLLESAGIPYFAKGEQITNLFGCGNIGSFNAITRSIEIQVPQDEVENCKEVLEELD